MQFGSPEFVLTIIGMAMFAGVMKSAIRAKHGMSDFPIGRRARRELRQQGDQTPGQVESLKSENKRLTDQVETMQDRLIVLEKIVTDRGYTLASEIEALRDRRDSRGEDLMMGPGEAIAAVGFFGMLIAVVCVGGVSFQRWVSYKQRKAELDAEAHRAALSDRGDYAEMLEERIRVLERIATDRGQRPRPRRSKVCATSRAKRRRT